jgi:O-glycosyl hydrolase
MLLALGLAGGALIATSTAAEPAAAATTVRLTPQPAYQGPEFQGWGTSLVWFANATGGYPEEVRQDLFDKVFGPDGLNLNIARYNIGGGNATDVPSYLRPGGAVDGWWNPDLEVDGEPVSSEYADRAAYAAAWNPDDPSHYDFDADATQRWWIDALAAARDDVVWEAFSNSPPYFLTKSGFVSGGIADGSAEQLPEAAVEDFVGYLTTVVEELEREHGIDFATLAPFNEPNTDYWATHLGSDGWPTSRSRQEGAHIGPEMQDLVIKALQERLAEPGTTTDVAISAMDETNPGTFVRNWDGISQQSKDAVEQLNVHTYGTTDRVVVRDIAKSAEKPLWMSEVEGDWDGTGHNLVNIDNGIGMAGRIVDDLRELEPNAWVFWQPVEDHYNMEFTENLNWGSVMVDFDCNADSESERRLADEVDDDPSCEVVTNAKYNTVRNFTHFIEPGDHVIPSGNAQTTAAVNGDGAGLDLVHINSGTTDRALEIDLSRFADFAPGATVTPVVTTQSPASDPEANALVRGEPIAIDAAARTATVTVPAKSVTTLVIDGVSGVAEGAAPFEDGERYQLVGAGSGKALTASAASDAPGAAITTPATEAAAATAQTWTVDRLTEGVGNRERIALGDGSGRWLRAVGDRATELVEATAEQVAGDRAFQWFPTTTLGTTWSLVNAGNWRTLEVGGQSTAENAPVGVWTSNNGAHQQWNLRSTAIEGFAPAAVRTVAGVEPVLTTTTAPRYAWGTGVAVPVTWSTEGVDWQRTGTVVLRGSGTDVYGNAFDDAELVVEVGGVTATDPVSLTTFAGVSPEAVVAALPTSVPAQVGASSSRFELPVRWDTAALTAEALAAPGSVTVDGEADPGDGAQALPARLTVIVTEASQRNVAGSSTVTATFTEPGYSPARTVDGVPGDKAWSNWKSGTKNAQDTLTYTLARPETLQRMDVQFFKDGGSATWPVRLLVEVRAPDGDWTALPEIDVADPPSGPAPTVSVDLTTAPGANAAGVRADAVRFTMTAQASTHLIVSETEILAQAAAPSDVVGLGRLTVDGADVEGFDPAVVDYAVEVEGSRWPTVAAVATDADARVSVRQASDADPTATVTTTAPDGTVGTVRVAVERRVGVTDAPALELGADRVLRLRIGTDPADADLAVRWLRDGEPVEGADAAELPAGDGASRVEAVLTASAEGYRPSAELRAALDVPAAPEPGGPGQPEGPGQPGGPGEPGEPPLAPGAGDGVVDFGLTAGATLRAGDPVDARLTAAGPGLQAVLELRSTPVALASAQVAEDGSARLRGTIPASTTAGQHTLVVLSGGEVVAQLPVSIRSATTGTSALGATGAEHSGAVAGAALLALLLGASLAVGAGLRRRRA